MRYLVSALLLICLALTQAACSSAAKHAALDPPPAMEPQPPVVQFQPPPVMRYQEQTTDGVKGKDSRRNVEVGGAQPTVDHKSIIHIALDPTRLTDLVSKYSSASDARHAELAALTELLKEAKQAAAPKRDRAADTKAEAGPLAAPEEVVTTYLEASGGAQLESPTWADILAIARTDLRKLADTPVPDAVFEVGIQARFLGGDRDQAARAIHLPSYDNYASQAATGLTRNAPTSNDVTDAAKALLALAAEMKLLAAAQDSTEAGGNGDSQAAGADGDAPGAEDSENAETEVEDGNGAAAEAEDNDDSEQGASDAAPEPEPVPAAPTQPADVPSEADIAAAEATAQEVLDETAETSTPVVRTGNHVTIPLSRARSTRLDLREANAEHGDRVEVSMHLTRGGVEYACQLETFRIRDYRFHATTDVGVAFMEPRSHRLPAPTDDDGLVDAVNALQETTKGLAEETAELAKKTEALDENTEGFSDELEESKTVIASLLESVHELTGASNQLAPTPGDEAPVPHPGFSRRPVASTQWGYRFRPRDGWFWGSAAGLSNLVDWKVGIHAALLDFDPDKDAEAGLGFSASALGNLLHGGYGWNLGVDSDRTYWYVGVGLLSAYQQAAKREKQN